MVGALILSIKLFEKGVRVMKKLLVAGAFAVLLSGCASSSPAGGGTYTVNQARMIETQVRNSADYWQRTDSVSAQYLVGPKAQYQLHTDIAACVVEVRELVRLGSIRKAQPPKDIAMDQGLKGGWVSATRNGPLYAENQPFQDFDGCMNSKGWARAQFVAPVVAASAAKNYTGTILGVSPGVSVAAQTDQQTGGFNN